MYALFHQHKGYTILHFSSTLEHKVLPPLYYCRSVFFNFCNLDFLVNGLTVCIYFLLSSQMEFLNKQFKMQKVFMSSCLIASCSVPRVDSLVRSKVRDGRCQWGLNMILKSACVIWIPKCRIQTEYKYENKRWDFH